MNKKVSETTWRNDKPHVKIIIIIIILLFYYFDYYFYYFFIIFLLLNHYYYDKNKKQSKYPTNKFIIPFIIIYYSLYFIGRNWRQRQ